MVNVDHDKMRVRIRKITYKSAYALYEGWELTLNASKSRTFPLKPSHGKDWKY